MDNKIIFREILSDIKKTADEAGNVITQGEIRRLLEDLPLEEEHFRLIYDYLAEQDIRVVESEEDAEELVREQEQKCLSMYLEELTELESDEFEDDHELMRRVMEGEKEARERLIESYLPLICEMAGGYQGTDLPAEDLIQEGNLGLLTAMNSLQEFDSPAACRAHILNEINRAMEQAINSSQEKHRQDEGIVSRVNHLNEAVKNLERDLEHKVSATELSAYLEMPLEEIRDILRMSGDQIDIE